MNPEFHAALNRCTKLAGKYEGWNERYRQALAAENITMIENPNRDHLCFIPEDWLWAPWPVRDQPDSWPKETALIWNRPR